MPMKPTTRHARGTKTQWNKLRTQALHRDANQCTKCHAPNHQLISRSTTEPYFWISLRNKHQTPPPGWTQPTKVLLSIHHRNGDPTNNDLDNLTTLCTRCAAIADRQIRKAKPPTPHRGGEGGST